MRPSSLLNAGGLHVHVTTNSCIKDLPLRPILQGLWSEEVSKSLQLTTGVPQGSVFCPLLFRPVTYLSPVIKSHDFSYSCYTDDKGSLHFNKPKISASISGNFGLDEGTPPLAQPYLGQQHYRQPGILSYLTSRWTLQTTS